MSADKPAFTDDFVDDFLFANVLTLDDYFVRRSPISEFICYANEDGQKLFLSISNDQLFKAALVRLHALGVKVVEL